MFCPTKNTTRTFFRVVSVSRAHDWRIVYRASKFLTALHTITSKYGGVDPSLDLQISGDKSEVFCCGKIRSRVFLDWLAGQTNAKGPLGLTAMNGSHDMRQKRKRAEMIIQRRGYFFPGFSMNSELELPLDLLLFSFVRTRYPPLE